MCNMFDNFFEEFNVEMIKFEVKVFVFYIQVFCFEFILCLRYFLVCMMDDFKFCVENIRICEEIVKKLFKVVLMLYMLKFFDMMWYQLVVYVVVIFMQFVVQWEWWFEMMVLEVVSICEDMVIWLVIIGEIGCLFGKFLFVYCWLMLVNMNVGIGNCLVIEVGVIIECILGWIEQDMVCKDVFLQDIQLYSLKF